MLVFNIYLCHEISINIYKYEKVIIRFGSHNVLLMQRPEAGGQYCF